MQNLFLKSTAFLKKIFKQTSLAFILLLLILTGHAETKNISKKPVKRIIVDQLPDIVTVAAVRKSKDGKTVQVLFNEKAQIYTIKANKKSAINHIKVMENAFRKKLPLKLSADHKRASIKAFIKPSAKEIRKFRLIRKKLVRSKKPVVYDKKKIDLEKFNRIKELKFPAWFFCKKTVPSYAKAKEIFDYCAKQSCNLPGPYNVSPCIPFQYVRDGCYARAHKMKWIIRYKFGYCSQKVFSFANQNSDQLSVIASKWGGCCVNWWYHVAPVIKVKSKIIFKGKTFYFTLAYVIDPGMFDKPVLLSTWLNAQENPGCSSHANVSTYTIQPSSAYTPANYAGTAFTTDPGYTHTNSTLNAYKNLVTCP